MSGFETGISRYVHATATVDVYFPVDARGVPAICCEQCPYYRVNSRRCGLTDRVCAYPGKYVGAGCPLREVKGEKDG